MTQDIVSVLRTYPLRRWSGEGLVGRTVVAPISEFMYCNPASLLGDSLGPGKRRRQTGVLTTANNMELPSQPMETDAIVLDSASTSICGIIRAYNPALDKFYISWGFVKVDSSEGHCKSVESMLALREEKGTIRFIPPWVGCSELPYDGRGDPLDVNIRAFLDLSLCFPDINYYTTFSKTSSVVDAAVAGTPELTMDDLKCSLCCESTIRFLNAPISEDCLRIVKDGDAFNQTYSSVFSLKECDLCHRKYHEGCMPEITSDVFDKSKKGPRLNQGNWCCWFCLECEECKASAWKSKLVRLNLTNLMISTGGTAKSLPISAAEKVVCIACADKYSELKREYCPICIKVYPSDEEVAIKVSTNGTVVASPVILPTVSLNFPIPAAPYIFPHLSDRKAVARMRYDGDCQSGTININAALPGHADLCSFTPENVLEDMQLLDDISDGMVECSECGRWVHARCESINKDAFEAIGNCSHPIWGGEYLCPKCRFNLCEKLLASLEERDIYGLFAEPVSDDVAPGYSEMIRNPMDLSTMRRKLLTGAYKSLHTLRQDFELVCDNAFRFNKHGDKYWKATLLFFLRGESVFSKSRVSSLSVYGENILKIVARDEINKTISNDLNKVVAAKPPKVGGAKDSDSGKDSQRPKNPKFASHVSIFEKNCYHMPSWLNQWLNETPKSAPLRRGDVVKFDAAPTGPVNEYARERGTSNRSSRYEAKALDCVAVAGEASQVDGIETATPSTIINDIETAAPVSLPKQLIVSAIDGAASYIRSNVLTLTPELAFYDCCRDKCLVCGCAEIENSSSDAATMIFCTGCGEGFHSFCIMPNRSSSTLLRSDWKCTNCSTCEICDDAYGASYSGYIYCDCCDRAYHLACVAPKLLAVPSGVWYCKVRCTKHYILKLLTFF